MFPLAQTSPDPIALKNFLEVAFYLVGGFAATVALWKMLLVKPGKTELAGQPLEFRAASAFATKEEHTKLEQRVAEEASNGAKSRKGLYLSLEQQGKEIAALKTETIHQTRQLTNLDGKMDQVLMRLPRLP